MVDDSPLPGVESEQIMVSSTMKALHMTTLHAESTKIQLSVCTPACLPAVLLSNLSLGHSNLFMS